jgi:hypothetical protein
LLVKLERAGMNGQCPRRRSRFGSLVDDADGLPPLSTKGRELVRSACARHQYARIRHDQCSKSLPAAQTRGLDVWPRGPSRADQGQSRDGYG